MLGLPGLISKLLDDALAVARAEFDLVKSKAMERVRRSRTAIILLVFALVIAQSAMIGLIVGLVLELAIYVGPAGAGVILFVVGLGIAGVLAWIAIRLFSPPPAPEPTP